MGGLINPNQIALTDPVTTPDTSHEYVAGVVFSTMGYGESCVAIADVTDRTLVVVYCLAKLNGVPLEDLWVSDILRKWNINRWRYADEKFDNTSFERYIPVFLDTYQGMGWRREVISYNHRIGNIQDISGIGAAYKQQIDNRHIASEWGMNMQQVLLKIANKETGIADHRFATALCQMIYEFAPLGDRIRMGYDNQSLLEAGLLACIEMDHQLFTME